MWIPPTWRPVMQICPPRVIMTFSKQRRSWWQCAVWPVYKYIMRIVETYMRTDDMGERERDEGGGRRDDERGCELPGARCSLCLFDVCLSWGKWRMAEKFSSTQFSSVQLYLCNSTLLQSCPRALYSVGCCSSNSRSQLGGDLPFEKAATSSGSWLSDWRNEIETSTRFWCEMGQKNRCTKDT